MEYRLAMPDRATLSFAALVIVIMAARIAGLQASSLELHFDEAQYWAWAQKLDWGYFSKPPLIAWAIAATTGLFGDAEWAVRLSAPFAQGLTACALFALTRSMYGGWAGFWAGFTWLMAPAVWLSSGIISTDALLLALWSGALYALWRLTETRAWAWAVALGVLIGFGLLAKYAMLYFVLGAALAAWWARPARAGLFAGPNPAVGLAVLVAVWLVALAIGLNALGPHDFASAGFWFAAPGLAIAGLWFSGKHRARVFGAFGARAQLALGIAFVIVSPNLAWNITHSFATVSHTAANAHFTANLFHPDELFEFVGSQAWVVGPVIFGALVVLFARAARRPTLLSTEDKVLLAFALPPLVVIMTEALLSRANPNWAVAAYPSAIAWLCGRLMAGKTGRRVLFAGTGLNLVLGLAVAAVAILPGFADSVPGAVNGLKRVRGWRDTAAEVAARAAPRASDAPFTAVLVDDRATYYELNYYWRDARAAGDPLPPVRMWLLHAEPHNHAEAADPMRVEEGARVLIVHASPRYTPVVAGDFTTFRSVERLSIPLGAGKTRDYEISVGEGFAPALRDDAFEARLPQ